MIMSYSLGSPPTPPSTRLLASSGALETHLTLYKVGDRQHLSRMHVRLGSLLERITSGMSSWLAGSTRRGVESLYKLMGETDSGRRNCMQRRAKGTGRVYQRGKTWWIRFTRDGKTYDESSHSPFRDAAERFLRQRLEAPVDRKPTLNDVLDALVLDYELRGKDVYKMQSHMKPVREQLALQRRLHLTC